MIDDLFQKITDIIKIEFKNSFPGGTIILEDSTSKPVKINKKGKSLCIQPDMKIEKWKNNFPFFKSSIPDLCSIADHLIFYPTEHALYVFIIELKSSNPKGAINQVRASYELSRYICNTAKRLLKYPEVNINYRGIVFSNKIMMKGTTKPKKLKYTKQNNTNLKFKHLQSGRAYHLDYLSV